MVSRRFVHVGWLRLTHGHKVQTSWDDDNIPTAIEKDEESIDLESVSFILRIPISNLRGASLEAKP
jgi:hypothetical protein